MGLNIDFVIIGGQKCSSTYIQHTLNSHPEIYLPEGELPYFESPYYERNGILDLKQKLVGINGPKIGIKRPNYLLIPDVAKRIGRDIPKTKLICILRNPFERIISAYFHYVNYGFLPPMEFNKGISYILNGKFQYSKFRRAHKELIEFGLYFKGISSYLKYFKEQQILILFHDDLKRDGIGLVKTCYEFLSVDRSFLPGEEVLKKRPQKVNYSIPRAKWLRLRNNFRFKYIENRMLLEERKGVYSMLPVKFINLIDKKILSYIWNENNKPVISKDNLTRLREIYIPDIDNLEKLTGRKLDNWTKPPD